MNSPRFHYRPTTREALQAAPGLYYGIYATDRGHEIRFTTRGGELLCLVIGQGQTQRAYRTLLAYLRAGVLDVQETAALNVAVNTVSEMSRPRSFLEYVSDNFACAMGWGGKK